MTFPGSGPISFAQINVELGRASSANMSIGGSAERTLAGVPSGPIAISQFYGKTAGGGGGPPPTPGKSASYVGTASGGSGTSVTIGAPFGADAADRRIVCVVHWSGAAVAAQIASATIAGVAAGVVRQFSQSGGITSHGCGIIIATVPSGASGNVVLNFTTGVATGTRVGVYRLSGGFTGAATGTDMDTSETPTTNLSVSLPTPAAGCVVAGFMSNDPEFSNWGNGLSLTYGGGTATGGFNASVGAGTFNSGATVDASPTGGNIMVIASFG